VVVLKSTRILSQLNEALFLLMSNIRMFCGVQKMITLKNSQHYKRALISETITEAWKALKNIIQHQEFVLHLQNSKIMFIEGARKAWTKINHKNRVQIMSLQKKVHKRIVIL